SSLASRPTRPPIASIRCRTERVAIEESASVECRPRQAGKPARVGFHDHAETKRGDFAMTRELVDEIGAKRATWSSLGGRRSSDRTTRAPRSRESALLATDQRKTPRVAHGEEADDEAHAGREPRREADRPRVGLRDDLDDGGDERRQRVDLLGEDD